MKDSHNLMRRAALLLVVSITLAASGASAEALFATLDQSDNPKRATISFSPCKDDPTECVSYSLACGSTQWGGPEFTIITGDVEEIARRLIIGTKGQAKVSFKLAGGATTVDATVWSVHVDVNELDGGWLVALEMGEDGAFLDALTARSSEGASLEVAGQSFSLAPQNGGGKTLLAWKNACVAIRQ